jgi:hypothetical protein
MALAGTPLSLAICDAGLPWAIAFLREFTKISRWFILQYRNMCYIFFIAIFEVSANSTTAVLTFVKVVCN